MLINAVPNSESNGFIDFIKHYKELKGTQTDSFIKQ
jgi:hypothetical protein